MGCRADAVKIMRDKDTLLFFSIATAAVLWFVMFSPWTSDRINFWLMMSLSAVVLCAFAFIGRRLWRDEVHLDPPAVCLGIAIAAALWGVFWIGGKVSSALFSFPGGQIAAIYALRDGHSAVAVGLALLLIIGPAEEIFWRGYVQHELSLRCGSNAGFLLATLIYTLVHLWSCNLMLLLAAFAAGAAWGLLYRLFPRHLVAIILSHAIWDCVVFVVFPIA